MPIGFRVHQAIIFHPLLAHLQASPENENSDLDWRCNLYYLLCFDLCARHVLCNTASWRNVYHTLSQPSRQGWNPSFGSICCYRAGLRSLYYHIANLRRLPASALKSAEVQYQFGILDWSVVSIL